MLVKDRWGPLNKENLSSVRPENRLVFSVRIIDVARLLLPRKQDIKMPRLFFSHFPLLLVFVFQLSFIVF